MQCSRYEMDCPVNPCPRICEAGKIRPPLRYPNLEVPSYADDPRSSEEIIRDDRDQWPGHQS